MGTVVGTWRLKSIIVILVFISCIYTSYLVFGSISEDVNEEGYIVYNQSSSYNLAYNETTESIGEGQGFIDVLFGIGDFLTFGNIDNIWVRFMFNIVMTICWISIGYIIYTFAKEWIPFV